MPRAWRLLGGLARGAAWALSWRLVVGFAVDVMLACENEAAHEGAHSFIIGVDLVHVFGRSVSMGASGSGWVVGCWRNRGGP